MNRIWSLAVSAALVTGVLAPAPMAGAVGQPGARVSLVTETRVARVAAAAACPGNTFASLPVSGDITNEPHTRGGYFYWKGFSTSPAVCIGTVRERVHYTTRATKTWRVHLHVGSAHTVIAQKTFTLGAGYYFWDFVIRKEYPGISKLCVGASDTPGFSCTVFDRLA